MTRDSMYAPGHYKVITAILPKGRATRLVRMLVGDWDLASIDVHYARGVGRLTPLRHRGIGEAPEKEIVTVMIDAEHSNELFEYIYEATEIDRPHGGLMYMHWLSATTAYTLPDLPEEK